MDAAAFGSIDAMKLLLDRGADRSIDDFGGWEGATALGIAPRRLDAETVSMLLAAGGARVTITYARGRADAEHLAGLVNAACPGQTCLVRAYDAFQDASPQLAGIAPQVTQLYYFATSHIFLQKPEGFVSSVFQTFSRLYVDAFHACCTALQPRPLAVFYPSSVAVELRPPGMLEYAMAKAAGEMLCDEMHAKGWKIVKSRLPRLLTDQTATVAEVETTDPIDVMLPLIREM